MQNNNKINTYTGDNVKYDSWIHIDDVINGYILILLAGYNGKTYNLVNSSQSFTYLDTAIKVIQQLKPNQPVNNWLNYVSGVGNLDVQTKGFIKPSNLDCFSPHITLQSEINKLPLTIN